MAASAYACLPPVTHTLSQPQHYLPDTAAATAAPAASFLSANRTLRTFWGSLSSAGHSRHKKTLSFEFRGRIVGQLYMGLSPAFRIIEIGKSSII